MIRKIILSAAAFALVASAALASDVVLATGKAGGGYDKADKVLAQRLEQRGTSAEILNLNGSDEITLAVCSGKARVGRTQIDAIYKRALEGCQLAVAGLHGDEVALMLYPPKSKFDELSDLTSASKVLVDTVGSGSELFWRTIVSIEQGDDGTKDDWSEAKPVLDTVTQAHALASFGDVDVVVMVRKPDSPDVQNLMSLGWKLGYLWDKDIDDQLFNDKPLYEALKVQTGGQKNWGYKVGSFVVVKASDDEAKTLVRSAM